MNTTNWPEFPNTAHLLVCDGLTGYARVGARLFHFTDEPGKGLLVRDCDANRSYRAYAQLRWTPAGRVAVGTICECAAGRRPCSHKAVAVKMMETW
jgi:hypothetical protein